MAPKRKTAAKAETGANLGFEAKLWAAADALRNNMDASIGKAIIEADLVNCMQARFLSCKTHN